MGILTDRPVAGVLALDDWFHVVDKSDPSSNPAGTSKKSTIQQIVNLVPAPTSTFLALTDTPGSYATHALKGVRVNAGATALEFYVPSDLNGMFDGGNEAGTWAVNNVTTAVGLTTIALGSNDIVYSTAADANGWFVDGSTGFIGMGTAIPTRDFHIVKNASNTLIGFEIRNTSTSTATGTQAGFVLRNDNNSAAQFSVVSSLNSDTTIQDRFVAIAGIGLQGFVISADDGDIDIYTGAGAGRVKRATFLSTGNFGIGTTIPTYTTHIVSTADAAFKVQTAANANVLEAKSVSALPYVGINQANPLSTITQERLGVGGEIYSSTRVNVGNISLVTTGSGHAKFGSAQAGQNAELFTTSATDDIQLKTGAIVQMHVDGTLNNIGIGTATPDASALVDMVSTTKGFAPPSMTGAQVEAITTPKTSLIAYATSAGAGDVTTAGWWGWNGANWIQLG